MQEVAELAADGRFDSLVIESTGNCCVEILLTQPFSPVALTWAAQAIWQTQITLPYSQNAW